MSARKTEDVWVLQGWYKAYGWEDLTAETSRAEIIARRRDYTENEPGTPLRIQKRRMKIASEECGCARENPLSPGAQQVIWTSAFVLGTVAIFGGIAYAASKTHPPEKQITPPKEGGGGAAVGKLVTEPTIVTEFQKGLAAIEGAPAYKNLGWPAYDMALVDGDAKNPKFVAALTAFQKWFNASFSMLDKVNEQGVLDVPTGTALSYVNARLLTTGVISGLRAA